MSLSPLRFGVVLPLVLGGLLGCDRAPTDVPEPAATTGDNAAWACDSCAIQLALLTEIGELSVNAPLRTSTRLDVRPDGALLLAPLAERQSLGIIGATDTVVFGRSGEGPGEFRQIVMATGDDGDSLVVLSAGRISKFTPDLTFIRSGRTIPQVSAVLHLGHGRFVLTAYRAPGQPFLLFGDDLAPIRWLGDPHLDSDSLEHHAARDGAGGFWAAQTLPPHRVVHYRGDSLVASEWTQPAKWAASAVASDERSDPLAVRPVPRLTSIWADPARQLLWFTFTVADAEWRPRVAPMATTKERGMTRYDGVPRDELFDGLIEVRRMADGVLVASRRLPLPPSGITPDGTLYGMLEAEDGTLSMRVWRLSLNGEVQ